MKVTQRILFFAMILGTVAPILRLLVWIFVAIFCSSTAQAVPAQDADKCRSTAHTSSDKIDFYFVNQNLSGEKSYFYSEPKACFSGDKCVWLRKSFVMWGDLVTSDSAMPVVNGFRCVDYKSRSTQFTAGWIRDADLTKF